MSGRVTRGPPLRGYVSSYSRRGKTVLEVDLNVPRSENRDQNGTSAHANSRVVEPPAPIDVEAFDDDVVISSRRDFTQAKYNSRRSRGRSVVVDVDSEERRPRFDPNCNYKRRRVSPNQSVINCGLYINLEGSGNSTNVQSTTAAAAAAAAAAPPPPPPKETTFRCPICMGPLDQETSTKCGHIFCKACIKAAIAAQGKCPTCRRKVTGKDTIRVYLPATN